MKPIEQAIQQAKQNPNSPFASELRKRIESGAMDRELSDAGLEFSNGKLSKKQTFGQNLAETYTRAGERLKEGVQQAQEQFQAGQEMVDPESGIITPAGVAKSAGAVVRGVGRTLGTVAGATFAPVLDIPVVKEALGKGVEKALENETISNLATKASELAQKYPEASKDIEDIVNIATVGIGKVGEKPVQDLVTRAGQKAVSASVEGVPNVVSKVVSPLKSATKTITDVAQDVVPKASELRDRALAKALRLAPVEDIAAIKQSTGNDIGEFMNRFNLVKDTPGETVDALSKFTKQNRAIKQDAISLIENKFTFDDIPQMRDAVDFLKSDLAPRKSAEYQKAFQRLTELENKPNFELGDVEYVRELFDDIESIYKRTGDVRDAVSAQDKAQVIAPIRRFIEDRVQEVYPQIDIRQINNNTQTSRAIMDATLKRAPKSDTASFFQLGDLAILGVGNVQTPGLGYGALFAKKLIESSPVQLRLSRFFAGKSKAQDVVKGLTPDKLKEINNIITKELKASMDTPEIKSKVDDLQKALYKESQSTTTKNKIPKKTSIPKTIPQKKSLDNPTVGKTVDNLAEEAKKYKSAEEFVKAQGTPVYHGTKSNIDIKDLSAQPESRGQYLGNGIYFTKYKEGAELYGGKILDAVVNEKDFLDISKLQGVNRTKEIGSFGTYKQYLKNNSLEDTTTNFKKWQKNQQEVADKILEMGYKGVTDGQQHVIFDKSTLKTKSQLTDIWNKANKKAVELPKATSLEQEAKKYKSAEEFVKAQGTPVYRSGDMTKLSKDSTLGKVKFFADKKVNAELYGGNVQEAYVDIKNPYIISERAKSLGGKNEDQVKIVREMGGTEKFREFLKNNGYDGIKIEKDYGNEIIALDLKQIKTKSQLEDIWKQATNKKN